MAYGDNLAVMEKTRHAMTDTQNPFCQRCGFRTYPGWGEHDCTQRPDVHRIRHVAGDILSNLHFYRIPVEQQAAALCEAWAWVMASNCLPNRIEAKMRHMFPIVLQIAMGASGQNPNTAVQQIVKKRGLKAKVIRVSKARHSRSASIKATQRKTKKRVAKLAQPANSKRRR